MTTLCEKPVFDADLIQRYDRTGPRYTSYPTINQLDESVGAEHYKRAARLSNGDLLPRPLSLYVHIPFCRSICYYCGCNKIITADQARSAPYIDLLETEITLQSRLFTDDRQVDQLHWGGGTPTFLLASEMTTLMDSLNSHFNLRNDDQGDYSIEIDPRSIEPEGMAFLRELGFNRISLGVQDFNPAVQKAVNRLQDEQMTLDVLNRARAEGFRSINLDLIYGLPEQTPETLDETLDKVIAANPDRLAIYNYAHLPSRFPPQRRIDASRLPSAEQKLEMMQLCIDKLCDAGYAYIGMDHFAKPDDELATALQDGSLHRNFQGYSARPDCDLIGIGVSSISWVGNNFYQNGHTVDEYSSKLQAMELPIERGLQVDREDRIRGEIISQLMCQMLLDISRLETRWNLTFEEAFAPELEALKELEDDGLVETAPEYIRITPAGRVLARSIAMVFDRYLDLRHSDKRFSRLI